MKVFSKALVLNKGCFGCRKGCNFNGMTVSQESNNACKKDGDGLYVATSYADRYGCNTSIGWRR